MASTEAISCVGVGAGAANQIAPPRMWKDKAVMGDTAAEKERTLVINMTSAQEAARPRFLAVGFFLSTLLVSSDVLMERMKKVWRVRGHTEASQIEADEGRKFIIEFSEEGDRRHAVRGGPWQYKMDAFLIVAMEPGVDPTSMPFTYVPMWVQFRNIPFYLLTKTLAWELGWQMSTTIMIDNNSRGNITDKFLRARVQLPLYAALRKHFILEDEITGEKVKVQICYERLPNFCLFCGYIGHMEARCDLPAADRKIKFSMDMRVQAVHFDDPRAWFLPDAMGQAQAQPAPTVPWRATKPTAAIVHQAVVEQVAKGVAKLNVSDHNTPPTEVLSDKGDDPVLLVPEKIAEADADKAGAGVEGIVKDVVPVADNTETADKEEVPGHGGNQTSSAPPSDASSYVKETKRWKRKERGEAEVQSDTNTIPLPLEHHGDKVKVQAGRTRPREDVEEDNRELGGKKGHFEVPPLELCLGKEGLRKLKEAELSRSKSNRKGKDPIISLGAPSFAKGISDVCQPKPKNNMAWTAPADGWIKINVDASVDMMNGTSSIACLCRDHSGKVLWARNGAELKCQDVTEAEAMACLFGLQAVGVHEVSNASIILESDSSLVVEAIKRRNQGRSRI
ncbi:hypothetical protein ACQ4PT_015286 [Festuca glaucescens]